MVLLQVTTLEISPSEERETAILKEGGFTIELRGGQISKDGTMRNGILLPEVVEPKRF